MKVLTFLKKNKLMAFVLLIYVLIFIISPQKAIESVNNSVYYLVEMLQVLPIIFLLTVVIEAWVPKEVIMRGFGENSGIKGNLLSLLLGSISAGPIYAAFPIGKMLLGKGASITNIVIILSSWAVIKVPMLANEAKFLGLEFMAVRWILTVIAILAMSYLATIFVKKKDIPGLTSSTQTDVFTIKEEYCIGCGICSDMMPETYEIKGEKAKIKTVPDEEGSIKLLIETVEKCPTAAIVYERKIVEVI
jgi:uncharacterized membrane protein YraQ (UPF0718 family)